MTRDQARKMLEGTWRFNVVQERIVVRDARLIEMLGRRSRTPETAVRRQDDTTMPLRR